MLPKQKRLEPAMGIRIIPEQIDEKAGTWGVRTGGSVP
jgi:hypothetical protein